MAEEDIELGVASEEVGRLGEVLDEVEKIREGLLKPYGRLETESSLKVEKLIKKTSGELAAADEIYEQAGSGRERREVNRYMQLSGWARYGLESYKKTVERLEELGDKLIEHEWFRKVAQVAVEYGDLYVSGGAIGRATRGGFNFGSDIDVISEAKELTGMAKELTEKLTDGEGKGVDVVYREGRSPRVSIVEREKGREIINITLAGYFASEARKIGKALGEKMKTKSDIETMLVHWPTDVLSQVAIHFEPDLSFEIVNGGKPLLRENLDSNNETSLTDWEVMRQLEEKGAKQEAKRLLGRAIRGLARWPKTIEKGVNFPEEELELDLEAKEPKTYQIAMGEFLKLAGSDDPEALKFVRRVREDAAANLVKAIKSGDGRLWEDLVFYPFEGLFSEELMEARGFRVVNNGERMGGKFVVRPGIGARGLIEKMVALAVLTVPERGKLSLYGKGEICESATEFFAVMAGVSLAGEKRLRKIAGELSQNWQTEGFNPKLFQSWARQIKRAVQVNGVDLTEVTKLEEEEGKLRLVILGEDEEKTYSRQVGILVKAIKSTPFWEERLKI